MQIKSPALVLSLTTLCALALGAGDPASAMPPRDALPDTDHGPAFEDLSSLLSFGRVDDPDTAKLGGIAWVDFDDDGDLDLYLVNAPGGDNSLFRNDLGSFTDVAGSAGVTGDGVGYSGALAGDVDNDGCTDLFLTGAGGFFGINLPHRLYMNNCDGTFSDFTTVSGIDPTHPGLMAAFGDIDDDGYLDLFVASPGNFNTGVLSPQRLYHNDGDGTFTDISAAAGIDTNYGGCVASFSDFNEDGLADILVGNCDNVAPFGAAFVPIPGPWELWINQGNNTFVDTADTAGLNVHGGGFPMAITVADHDLDGDLDIFATNTGVADPFGAGVATSEQTLFDNNGDGTFSEVAQQRGLGGYEFGWGASFADFDNDGDQDLITVGSVAVPFLQLLGDLAGPGRVFENDGEGHMQGLLDLGLEFQATSGLAVADYDLDGFLDVVIQKTAYDLPSTPWGPLSGDGAPVLLHNQGNGNESITVRLVGTDSNAMGIGARLRVRSPEGSLLQTGEVVAGSSFLSTESPWPTFGMGRWHAAFVDVSWPSGVEERFVVPTAVGVTTLEEGTGVAL